jgi:hypothetical protein
MAQKKSDDGGAREGDGDIADLKEREYRDEQGNIHHHTKAYLAAHPEDKGRPPRSKQRGESSGEAGDR